MYNPLVSRNRDSSDQRRSGRRELLCRVDLLPRAQEPQRAVARNLSRTGILVGNAAELEPDTPIQIGIPLEGGRSALLTGKVVWCGRDPEESAPSYLIGVEFDAIPPEVELLAHETSERRSGPRRRASAAVSLSLPDRPEEPARVQDVSETGARFEISWRPELGEVVLVRGPDPAATGGEPLTGEVVWVRELSSDRFEIAVRFHRLCVDVSVAFDLGEFDA